MTTATARYIIAAEDRSKATLAAIKGGFKDMDRGVKTTIRSLNLALGVFVGVQLKQAFRQIIQATAESTEGQKGFAQALGDVRSNFRELMVARDGLPGATHSMQELAEILRDPTVREAADSLTSTLIKGFAGAAKAMAETVAGLKILFTGEGGNASVNIDNKIRELQAERARLLQSVGGDASGYPAGSGAADRLKEINTQLRILQTQWDNSINSAPPIDMMSDFDSQALAASIADLKINTATIESALKDSQDEFSKSMMDENERRNDRMASDKSLLRTARELDEQISEQRTKRLEDLTKATETAYEKQSRAVEGFKASLAELQAEGVISDEQAKARLSEFMSSLDTMSAYADQAARNMQDSFAEFLFNPFEDGLKGMLKGFIDTIRRMVAEAAAAQIFDAFKASGTGSALLSAGKSLLGFANGGRPPMDRPSIVGERGPEFFFPDSAGTIVPMNRMGAGGGSITVAPVYNIDARGATMELARSLPGILQKNSEATIAHVRDLKRRGRF